MIARGQYNRRVKKLLPFYYPFLFLHRTIYGKNLSMDAIAAKALLQRYLEDDASQEELIIIEQWYQQLVDAGEWNWAEGEREQLEAAMEAQLLGRISTEPVEAVMPEVGRAEVGRAPNSGGRQRSDGEGRQRSDGGMLRRRMLSWAAAAVLLAGIAGIWLLVVRKAPREIASISQRYRNDVRPGRNAAVLTLAGGKTIVLDDSAPRTIGRQGNAVVLNDSGQLQYKLFSQVSSPRVSSGKASEIFYNTLTTQKGNQYHLTLPDGTKVWLNAASSITYPTAFTGKERRVSISGEAYFEVVKNQQLPFMVQQADMTVEVLGTSFDVNGYGDDSAVKATLVEGKIRIEKAGASSVLEPGQQAVIGKAGNSISVDHAPDIEAVLAWKNGGFAFKDADIESIMRQVERWYDVQVEYKTSISKHFVADIPRNVPLSQLLKLLEATDQVHFRIDGKKVMVMP
jgi:ferric-dicitrate binding protein FerR (iron transport regulator)